MSAQKTKPRRAAVAAPQKPVKAVQPSAGAYVPMTPQDLEVTASFALGGRGWQKSFCRGTGLNNSTLTRYLQGLYPVPQYVAVIVEMLATLRRNGLPVPEAFSAESLAD